MDINTWISIVGFIAFPAIGVVYKHLRDVAKNELAERDTRIDSLRGTVDERVRQVSVDIEAAKAQVSAALLEQRRALGRTREELQAEVASNKSEHNDFRVYVEKNFVNTEYMKGFEGRIREEFLQLGSKLDRLIERNTRRDA